MIDTYEDRKNSIGSDRFSMKHKLLMMLLKFQADGGPIVYSDCPHPPPPGSNALCLNAKQSGTSGDPVLHHPVLPSYKYSSRVAALLSQHQRCQYKQSNHILILEILHRKLTCQGEQHKINLSIERQKSEKEWPIFEA